MGQSQVIKIVSQPLSVNTYILFLEDTGEAVVIDPSFYSERILKVLREEKLDCRAVLLTHGHFDHIAGVSAVREHYHAPVYIHAADAPMLSDPEKNMSAMMGGLRVQTAPAEQQMKNVEKLHLAGMEIVVLSTPGHSPGSVCYLSGDYLFSGDTLFNLSAGRTDFPGGSMEDLNASMELLKKIEKDYIVHPGHEGSTSLQFEKDNNPFMGNAEWSF